MPETRAQPNPQDPDNGWDLETDVVVVGFGAAGATTAIEASENGAEVLIVDTWNGGGATAKSAGILYMGGGTQQQRDAGFDDDVDKMYDYLCHEVGEFDNPRVREFCESSVTNKLWLEEHGIRFPAKFFPDKAVSPTDDDAGLYYSGNEKHFAPQTPAIPRGHRVAGRGLTGVDLFESLSAAVERAGVKIERRTRMTGLITDADGSVTGVEVLSVPNDPTTIVMRWLLKQIAVAAAVVTRGTPRFLLAAIERLDASRGTRTRIRARNGVVLCTGGFTYSRSHRKEHAPSFAGTIPLGTLGDDGSGITLAQGIGAQTRYMDICGASRFIIPPASFAKGVLVDRTGERICDEGMYAATLSRHIAAHGGRAWLIVDGGIREQVIRDIKGSTPLRGRRIMDLLSGKDSNVLFPKVFGPINLHLNRVMAPTIDELAERCKIPASTLHATLERYNTDARNDEPDEMGKPADLVTPLERAPWTAVRCDLDSLMFVAPMITLGGLEVDSTTQGVQRADGSVIPGLYAAGRAAVGIPSRSYVSGLSLADCVFAGRKAGRSAARADKVEASA